MAVAQYYNRLRLPLTMQQVAKSHLASVPVGKLRGQFHRSSYGRTINRINYVALMQSHFSPYAIGRYGHDLCARVFPWYHRDPQAGDVHTCIGGALWLRMLGRTLLIRQCACRSESEGDSSKSADTIHRRTILARAKIIGSATQPDVMRDPKVRTAAGRDKE